MVRLYTTETCPQCRFLEEKMTEKRIPFEICMEPDVLESEGITSVPVMELENGARLDMGRALRWIAEVTSGEGH